jgi:hypothetical protein
MVTALAACYERRSPYTTVRAIALLRDRTKCLLDTQPT